MQKHRILIFLYLFSLFFCKNIFTQTRINSCALVFKRDTIDVCKISSIVFEMPAQHKNRLDKLLNYLTTSSSNDYERLFAFYSYICENIHYDHARMKRIHKGKVKRVMYTDELLATKKGVCSDVSYLFKAMCDKSGIPCRVVTGYAGIPRNSWLLKKKKINHAWNAVMIDSTWYPLDATFGMRWSGKKDRGSVNYRYFLADTSYFGRSHLPADPTWQLKKDPISWSYFKWRSLSLKRHTFAKNYDYYNILNSRLEMSPAEEYIETAFCALQYNPGCKSLFIQMLYLPATEVLDKRRKIDKKLTLADYYEEQKLYSSLIEYCNKSKKNKYERMANYFENSKMKLDKKIESLEKKK